MYTNYITYRILQKPIIVFILALLYICNAQASNQLKIIAEHAELKLVSDSFQFTEGPTSDTLGNIYFSDIPVKTLYKYTTNNDIETIDNIMPGCNGLAFDNFENLVVCGNNQARCIYSYNINKNTKSNIACTFEGKTFNSPNDLWIDPNNGIYFTDPRYGSRENMELNTEQVYYISPDRMNVIQVTTDLVKPNGIISTDNGKRILIADPGQSKVHKYKIKKNGKLSSKKIFIENENVDGMTFDVLGNVYVASNNIKIFNHRGYLIEVINTPGDPTNVCFGGQDFKTLFITERNCVYTLQMNVKGNRY